ncbi:sigma-70 family RNA polymerase sigma factor [Micromonospora sp. CPCC 205371]|nr:sigma-70 family RNA polymerase sigma factor [Micromonospora sp. CPCC 205371]
MRSELVKAAQAGDQRALDQLVAESLLLVYNIVGRALDGHADVDDVVQETMLRVVHGLRRLRDPDSYRSWLVAISLRRVRDRGQDRRATQARQGSLDDAGEVADPGADFADLTVVRLGLSGQRKEVADATRWLDTGDRQLLSLWWLEAAGELTRAELATALELSLPHAAVRVQRMKAQLDAARAVVRALNAVPRCPELTAVTADWDGRPGSVWRKRLARHTRECPVCAAHWEGLVPADRLLVGLALVPLPIGLAVATATIKTAAVTGWLAKLAALVSKPVVAVTAGATVVAGGATVAFHAVNEPAVRGDAVFAAAPPPTAAAPTTATPAPRRSPTLAPPASRTPAAPRYGSVVDRAEPAPAKLTPPRALPERPAGGVTVTGDPVMEHRGDTVVVKGQGYVRVRYQVSYWTRPGGMVMPTWTSLSGRLFHVASGGLRRMDDGKPTAPAGHTWMGEPGTGYTVLPAGAQQFWQNEFFYLDGEVSLTNQERGADYNMTVAAMTRQQVIDDVSTPPPADPVRAGWVRYGVVRDTGDDGAPVPQYVTREATTDPARVPQASRV